MNFPFYIAKRYLLAKKSYNLINIISGISVLSVMVGTMALIIVLSVFNGFENLVVSLFSSFNPAIQITPATGKTFEMTGFPSTEVKRIPGVVYFNEVVEDRVMLQYDSTTAIATIKGVPNDYAQMNQLDTMITQGRFALHQDSSSLAVLGVGLAYTLNINLNDFSKPITVFVPKRGQETSMINPQGAFNNSFIFPSGIFAVQQDVDTKCIIVPIAFARHLFDYTSEVTSVELGLASNAEASQVVNKLRTLLGKDYIVKDRFQQQEMLFKVMKSEKFSVFIIFSFILLIAAFSMIGTLSMLILDKKNDIKILHFLGADQSLIKKIFFAEGMLVVLFGSLIGLLLGGVVCWVQQRYGIVPLESSGTFIISAYPVAMQPMDFVRVFVIDLIIGVLTVWYPVKQISKKYLQ